MVLLVLFLQGCSPVLVRPSPLPINQKHSPEYRIQPGDQMDIKFYYTPELNESVAVRPDGRVSLQLAHDIPAAGLTPAELTQTLTKSYAHELGHPVITVIMRSFSGQHIYVDGEVNKPALVPLVADMTVLQSISVAGGLKDSARATEIVVMRRGPDSKPQVFTLDLTRVLDGTDTGQDMILIPFDVVYVPKSPIANVNLWIDQYLRKNIPTSFGLGYQINNHP